MNITGTWAFFQITVGEFTTSNMSSFLNNRKTYVGKESTVCASYCIVAYKVYAQKFGFSY